MNKLLHSIRVKLLGVILLSAAGAVLVFAGTLLIGNSLSDRYLEHSGYLDRRNEALLIALQEYVETEGICRTDQTGLENWCSAQNVPVACTVYLESELLYGQIYEMVMNGNEVQYEESYQQVRQYEHAAVGCLTFADGDADVAIYGYFAPGVKNAVMIWAVILSSVTFLAVLLLLSGRHIRYIEKISALLRERPDPETVPKLPVRGQDELTNLVLTINHMGEQIADHRRAENVRQEEKNRFLTQLAHDIRTPMTALKLYTEEIRESGDLEEIHSYAKLSDGKLTHMEKLMDDLFQQTTDTVNHTKVNVPIEICPAAYSWGDSISELIYDLEQDGFTMQLTMDWPDQMVRFNSKLVDRVCNNLFSNLHKYADSAYPVDFVVTEAQWQGRAALLIEITNTTKSVRSELGVGIQSIREMLTVLKGTLEVTEKAGKYDLKIYLEYADYDRL